ncbi:TetR/AcrR family transcriptional regulator [Rhodococcus sp. IEGM 1379]|uniref:TetR/AcrR family transcriptional regulator n=1 Tax=Rhodococcus sp. IEGM 1379 TaxID=3047086 RepID=UPI0024B6923D|nr:TetR/AcrR family transcriptional regulator [Rhodococcus sp. IEGM 1379]MDI9916850.1 TetR/AcrR family transcriptional regulator [Rhodococcus sp. IEGM 1379]
MTSPALSIRPRVREAAAHFTSVGYAAASVSDIVTDSRITKGAMYFHFSSKKAVAQYLVRVWCEVLVETITTATAISDDVVGGRSAHRQLVAVFRELAWYVETDPRVRAGLLLSFESDVDENARVYRAWASAVTVIVEHAIPLRDLATTTITPVGLGESLCSAFVGAVQVATSLGEPESIGRRVQDLLALWLDTTGSRSLD